MFNPPHPGAVLREYLGSVSVTDLLHTLNALFTFTLTKLGDPQPIKRAYIVWIDTQSLLKSFSRFRIASSRAISDTQIHVSREVVRIYCGSLLVGSCE